MFVSSVFTQYISIPSSGLNVTLFFNMSQTDQPIFSCLFFISNTVLCWNCWVPLYLARFFSLPWMKVKKLKCDVGFPIIFLKNVPLLDMGHLVMFVLNFFNTQRNNTHVLCKCTINIYICDVVLHNCMCRIFHQCIILINTGKELKYQSGNKY